jgi:hypothetical protein
MKRLFSIYIFGAVFLSFSLNFNLLAQSSKSISFTEKMSFQAVVRNTDNSLITSESVGVRISILQGSFTGTEVYQETYSPDPQTNVNGLLTLEIGSGTPLTGIFSEIDWTTGPYYIKTEIDPEGGTDYTIKEQHKEIGSYKSQLKSLQKKVDQIEAMMTKGTEK